MHIPHTSGVDIHFFLDFFVVGINSLNLVIYLAAIACEVCSINGKANFAVHIAVNRTGQIQANNVPLTIIGGVMPRYNIRSRLQISFTYLPNVVRLALFGFEAYGVFFVRKRLHFGASFVLERAAVEVLLVRRMVSVPTTL